LYEKGQKEQFYETLKWMAKVNGKEEVDIEEIM
jgi:hypothetical protein